MSYELPDPRTEPELFDGVLTRRVIAYFIDMFVMSVIVMIVLFVGGLAGIFTAGLAWGGLLLALPASIVIYYAVTLGSPKRATVGMSIMDILLTPTGGTSLDGWRVFLHPTIFWLTCWILPPFSLLFALFTPRRQMLHDLLTGTLMVRRSPMQRHWDNFARQR